MHMSASTIDKKKSIKRTSNHILPVLDSILPGIKH